MASSTPIAFPSSEPAGATTEVPASSPRKRQHLLSFRRISLPTAPSLLNRQSSASSISYKSLPEEEEQEDTAGHAGTKSNNSPSKHVNRWRNRRRGNLQPADGGKATKRKKIIAEFYDTERAYVDGLDLIFSHFLTPLIESLDSSVPLISREDLTAVFSNFIDIWNLHRSFFTSLTEVLSPFLSDSRTSPPPLSPVLISHFPYLSLYTPFVSSFADVMAKLSDLQSSSTAFGSFIKSREADERCGKLKLRDWLLTVVQRCPRYMLLLKDLIDCTDREDPERNSLITAHSLLQKGMLLSDLSIGRLLKYPLTVTASLDTSLHAHAQTLSLLALQRATLNLPIQLVSPGRTLLKRGRLMQQDNSSALKEREFLLFSDCLVWLASDKMIEAEWLRRGNGSENNGAAFIRAGCPGRCPEFRRTRSKSENELPDILKAKTGRPPASPKKTNEDHSAMAEEKWWFKGKADLVDIEVVLGTAGEPGYDMRLEILNPEMSFAMYAENEQSRDDWVSALRSAKASLLVSLNVMHPNSTLASSSSTNHIRRSLQAFPYLPEEGENQAFPKRGKVDHFVPAIWVPDGKTDSCMRCGRPFGWRRRRHHCRLCGRCICAGCSERTFFVNDPSANTSSKPARACNACYDTVFPLIDTSASEGTISAAHSGSTLSSFPSWRTQKPVPSNASRPSELMELAIARSPSESINVIQRLKARPFSHPVIPKLLLSNEDREDVEDTISTSLGGPQKANTEETEPVLGDISNASLVPDVTNPFYSTENVSPRARKRFSMPAIALQTTTVTTHPKISGEGASKRFSLVLGNKQKGILETEIDDRHPREVEGSKGRDLRQGVTAARLQELLRKSDV